MEGCKINFGTFFFTENYLNLLSLSDGTLRTEDDWTFEIHRFALAKNSMYFRALFCGMNKEKREFLIPGIAGEILSEVVSYLYTGDISLSVDNVTDILIAADYLLLDDLVLKIKDNIADYTTTANSLSIFLSAEMINNTEIQQESFRFIVTHFENIMHEIMSEVVELPFGIMELFLQSRSLNVTEERSVWMVVLEWVQHDIQQRLLHVPSLLVLMAEGDIDEALADEITRHSIVSDYLHCADLNLVDNSIIFRQYLNYHFTKFTDVYNFRIPRRLHVFAQLLPRMENNGRKTNHCQMYVTYDEKSDLWRNILEVHFQVNYLISCQQSIYMFSLKGNRCLKYDLKEKSFVPMTYFSRNYYYFQAFKIDRRICVFGRTFDMSVHSVIYNIEFYDPETNTWADGQSLSNITGASAVSVSKNIFVLGNERHTNLMIAFVYDSVSNTWSPLPRPTVFHIDFAFVAFRKKLFVIGGSDRNENLLKNVEMFDTTENTWLVLPVLPFIYTSPRACIFNDQIIVYNGYDKNDNSKNIRWNDAGMCWERMKGKELIKNFQDHCFCEIKDIEAIRIITKENRDPNAKFQKCN